MPFELSVKLPQHSTTVLQISIGVKVLMLAAWNLNLRVLPHVIQEVYICYVFCQSEIKVNVHMLMRQLSTGSKVTISSAFGRG